MLEDGGYRLGKKKAVVGPDYKHVMFKMPTSTYNKLVHLSDICSNSLNRQIITLIEEHYFLDIEGKPMEGNNTISWP